MAKYRLYKYQIQSDKYLEPSIREITLRSSWELDFAKHCDLLPTVIQWGYEMIQIPYRDPLTGKQKVYIPDFYVRMYDKNTQSLKDFLFEIKPMHEQLDNHARNREDAALIARNKAKWAAAIRWASRHNAEFQVINESDLYDVNKKGRVRPVKAFAPTHTSTKKATSGPSKATVKTSNRKTSSRKKAAPARSQRLQATSKVKSVSKTKGRSR